jgi:DivIVA domain-containing protein
MSFTFPHAAPKKPGYAPKQVDDFITKAREQFANEQAQLVSAADVRGIEFDLVHGGYDTAIVDNAMDKLEDSFATREIQRQRLQAGEHAVADRLARVVDIVQGRTERPKRKRFSNTGWLLRGYSRKQVDALCEHIERHLVSGAAITLDDVRRIVFNAKRGGYVESQVDAFIDRVVEALHIENNR